MSISAYVHSTLPLQKCLQWGETPGLPLLWLRPCGPCCDGHWPNCGGHHRLSITQDTWTGKLYISDNSMHDGILQDIITSKGVWFFRLVFFLSFCLMGRCWSSLLMMKSVRTIYIIACCCKMAFPFFMHLFIKVVCKALPCKMPDLFLCTAIENSVFLRLATSKKQPFLVELLPLSVSRHPLLFLSMLWYLKMMVSVYELLYCRCNHGHNV